MGVTLNSWQRWFLGGVGLALPMWAAAATMDPNLGLNQTMLRIGQTMETLFPLIVAHRPLDDKEKQSLRESVASLQLLFAQVQPHMRARSETYQISYEYMQERLRNINKTLQSADLTDARSQLYELGSICSSCHTQDSRGRTLFPGAQRSRFDDDYSYAEFNFITRNYEEALRYFDAYLRSPARKTEYEIILPLQRIITMQLQVRNDPAALVKSLRAYLSLPQHTRETREHLQGWIGGLESMAAANAAGEVDDFSALERQVNRVLAEPLRERGAMYATPQQEVERVWLRGQLYRYLSRHYKRPEMPKLLYWLALSDRAIGYNFYFSLADLYLKDCITHYAEYPYARLCYQEYEAYLEHIYTGAAGEFMPDDVRDELTRLRQALH